MTIRLISCTFLALSLPLLSGCAPTEFTTITILETPTAFVRLEIDHSVNEGNGHTHPLSLTPEQLAAVLSGIIVEEPWAKLPIYDDTSLPPRHPAFTEHEVQFFAPVLAIALGKATAEEIVTFYQSKYLSGTSREVTSGGLFVQGDELHIVLANYRSPTHYSADIGVADTTDDRLTPMRSLAPQRGRLDFDPPSARRETAVTGLTRLFHRDNRELIVLYRALSPRRPASYPSPGPAVPSPLE
ncbi:MAG: hypothetical protein Q8N00_01950 [Nitrospirota bacterium]|nr:hypothetical protein [Nitrospirota bacterium]MDP3596995.1 hypothetical protein [Nitrospirota bacterium]